MNYSLIHSLLSPLSGIEKLTLFAIIATTTFLCFDFIRRYFKKKKSSKMLQDYLYVKNKRWNDVVELLTNPNDIQPSDIHNKLKIDISKFDTRYRDLLYHELVKVNQNDNVNSVNLKLLIRTLYNKS